MEITVTPKSTRVFMHAADAPLYVRGFAKSTEGYGNPSFVLVNVRKDNSSLDLCITPQKAEELIVQLQAAISKATQ